MRTYVMRWMIGVTVALTGVACGPATQDNNNNGPGDDGATCERVEVDGTEYCVYRQSQKIIIETGYDCPVDLIQRHQVNDNMVVCSGSMDPPAEPVVERLEELVMVMNNSTNNVTTPNHTSPLNTSPNTSTRTCMDVESEHDALVANVDTSCNVDADCKEIPGGICALRQCGVPANVNVDESQYVTLGEEYDQLGCGQAVDCAACPPQQVVCENNSCVFGPLEEERTCEDIEQDFAGAVQALDTSCMAGADCKLVSGGICGLAQCQLPANVNADETALQGFEMEYTGDGCDTAGPVCAACEALEAYCDNNVCATRSANP